MRDFHLPGRSGIICQEAAIATSHPLATSAGLDVLRRGGNAVDAAICAAATLGIVEPEQSGVGGDCYALLVPGNGKGIVAIDGAGWSPAAANRDWYVDRGFASIPFDGPHSVTVPGAVDAWCRLIEDHGNWDLRDVLAPAIRYASAGHPVHERVAYDWSNCLDKLQADPLTASAFLPGGHPPSVGDVFRQPNLGRTLELIASQGRDGFYTGAVAEDIVDYLRNLGGLHTLDDFAEYHANYVDPITTGYSDLEIVQCPPSGQGITVLLMLRILEALKLRTGDPVAPARLHAFAEASKLAYAVRNRIVGDDTGARDEALSWLSGDKVRQLAAGIDLNHASAAPYPSRSSANTVYVTAVDRDRTVVSLISSVYQSFGSGLTSPRSGIVLQDRGAGFSLAAGHPNVIAGRKRPLHTIIPGLAMQNGKPKMTFGMVGGDFQPFGQCWLLSNMVDYGMSPQAAIDLPRAFAFDDAFRLERGIPAATMDALADMNHRPKRWPLPLGSGQIISLDWTAGTIAAGSDARTDGCAMGF